MPHSKTKSRRGNFKQKLHGRGEGHKSVQITKFSSKFYPSEFALKEEAFGTSYRQLYSRSTLRNSKVAFISAGKLKNDTPENVIKSSKEQIDELGAEFKKPVSQCCENSSEKSENPQQKQNLSEIECAEKSVHYDLRCESTSIEPSFVQTCPNSPTPSTSSEEIILFQGRKSERSSGKRENVTDRKLERLENGAQGLEGSVKNEQLQLLISSEKILSPKPVKKICAKLHETRLNPFVILKVDSNNDAINDYLSNIDPQDDNALVHFSKRDLGGNLDFNLCSEESPNTLTDNDSFGNIRDSRKKYNYSTVYTSDKPRTECDAQQTCEGSKKKVISVSSLNSTLLVNEPITYKRQNFKAELLDNFKHETSVVDDSNSSEESDCKDLAVEIFFHNQKNFERKANKIFLAEHRENEMSSDIESSRSDIQTTYLARRKFQSPSSSKRKKDKKRLRKREVNCAKNNKSDLNPKYDEYDIFDIMNFDRPSLSRRKTILKHSNPLMEEYMNLAIQNNRFKKQEKKKERELLRNLGLLGKKSRKQDLRVKYKSGINFDELKGEVKAFLMDGSSTLILPPMKKADRQVVHEIANMLKLKSKSIGSGVDRFPILYRTSRTTQYADEKFQSMELAFTRGFFPRKSKNAKRFSERNGPQDSCKKKAAVSYRDGEIVGGSAPEIAADNKGRTMLEKMGWSSGTALGASNNKGILKPLPHIVKKSKKGLA